MLMEPYIEKWPQAMALGLQPQNLSTTVYQLHCIADEIWYATGNHALDTSWYTKRMLVMKMYVATETYMV